MNDAENISVMSCIDDDTGEKETFFCFLEWKGKTERMRMYLRKSKKILQIWSDWNLITIESEDISMLDSLEKDLAS